MTDFKDMTEEEQKALEEASIRSAQNFGAPKDLFHQDYGWILLDGKPTEAYKEFYENHLRNLKQEEIPNIVRAIEVSPEHNNEWPFSKDEDATEPLTVGMLRKMLEGIPADYEVRYDGGHGGMMKGDFVIYHDRKEISING